jgi:hypothetical protein
VGLMTTFYCLRFETPPTWRVRSPYLYPSGTGWSTYIPRHWVPFRRLLRLSGLRWRYATPTPHVLTRLTKLGDPYKSRSSCLGNAVRIPRTSKCQLQISALLFTFFHQGKRQYFTLIEKNWQNYCLCIQLNVLWRVDPLLSSDSVNSGRC